MVAAEPPLHAAGQQAAGIVPCFGANSNEDMHRLQDEYQSNMLLLQHFQPGGPEKLAEAERSAACPASKAEAQDTSGTSMTAKSGATQHCFSSVL